MVRIMTKLLVIIRSKAHHGKNLLFIKINAVNEA